MLDSVVVSSCLPHSSFALRRAFRKLTPVVRRKRWRNQLELTATRLAAAVSVKLPLLWWSSFNTKLTNSSRLRLLIALFALREKALLEIAFTIRRRKTWVSTRTIVHYSHSGHRHLVPRHGTVPGQ